MPKVQICEFCGSDSHCLLVLNQVITFCSLKCLNGYERYEKERLERVNSYYYYFCKKEKE